MKRTTCLPSLIIAVSASLLLTACSKEQPEVSELASQPADFATAMSEQDLQSAQAAISAYATALKAELTSALQQGGPVNAIQVCNTGASIIGEKISLSHDVTINRISLKNRNPLNKPADWQREVLESFEQQQKLGQPPNTLDWSQVLKKDGTDKFRYMKAIPTGGLCLQCHGPSIAPQISQAIGELYPSDTATGFTEGQIRGAFVVTGNVSE